MQQKQRVVTTIDSYIQQFDGDVQKRLQSVRTALLSVIPTAEEGIKYGMPTLMLNGKNVVHFAAMKKHIGFYPAPSGIVAFQNELASYVTSKGAIQFSYNQRLPIALVKRIAVWRARQVQKSLRIKRSVSN
ncbi:MAG: DUF1801 domain-containing protein [Candidatus Doudnabacteria bacterium]|nr:DUF1801 domain-containing protein [Candidatus Doudnabacteria bacterium]